MAYNTTYQLRELYLQHSPYSVDRPEYYRYDSLLQWPSNGYFKTFVPDAWLLRQTLTMYDKPEAQSVAEQVFGSQARQERIGLKHLANILYERALLHKNLLKDIDHRLMQSQEKLSILRMHFPIDGGRSQQNLERLIIELEKQRHDEELNFWKDSTEIRQKLFDNAIAYSATRRRQEQLSSLEDKNA